MEENLKSCLDACLKCAYQCNQCYKTCLENNRAQYAQECISSCRDCADICSFTASLIQRGSVYANELIAVCEKACKQCAEICNKSCSSEAGCSTKCHFCVTTCKECADACETIGKLKFKL